MRTESRDERWGAVRGVHASRTAKVALRGCFLHLNGCEVSAHAAPDHQHPRALARLANKANLPRANRTGPGQASVVFSGKFFNLCLRPSALGTGTRVRWVGSHNAVSIAGLRLNLTKIRPAV